MTETLTTILVLIAILIVLRLIVLLSLQVISRLAGRSVETYRKVRARDDVSELSARICARFPKTSRAVHARLTPQRYTGLPLTLLVIAALYMLALLGGLIDELREADDLVHFDESINQRLTPLRTDGMVTVFAWITDLGQASTLLVVSLVTSALLWVHNRKRMIIPLWLSVIGSQITTYAGKYALARQRPEFVTEVVAITPSFPSGHSTSAMAVYGFIAYLVARELKTSRQRSEIVYWAAVLIAMVGFSRMLLSVHYASDVAAGFLVGGFWLLVGFALAEHKHRAPRPEHR